jgi:hypothetical protein
MSKIFQTSKVPTKIYILSCTHISCKINVSHTINSRPPPPEDKRRPHSRENLCSSISEEHVMGWPCPSVHMIRFPLLGNKNLYFTQQWDQGLDWSKNYRGHCGRFYCCSLGFWRRVDLQFDSDV